MSRHMRSRRANTALPGYDNEGFEGHPAAYANPAVDEYGFDSDFGEEPHEGPYRSGPPPASYGWTPDHPAAKDTLVEDFGLRQAMERKAAKCIRIAERQLGRNASQADIENLALRFMDLPNRSINTKLAHFADDTVRQNTRDVGVHVGPGNLHDEVVADFMADDLESDDLMADDFMADDFMAEDLEAEFPGNISRTPHRSHATKDTPSYYTNLLWGEGGALSNTGKIQRWMAKNPDSPLAKGRGKGKEADEFAELMADLEAEEMMSAKPWGIVKSLDGGLSPITGKAFGEGYSTTDPNKYHRDYYNWAVKGGNNPAVGNGKGKEADEFAELMADLEAEFPGNISRTPHRSHATKDTPSYYTNLLWGEGGALSNTGKIQRWMAKNPDSPLAKGKGKGKEADEFEAGWSTADVLAEEIEALKAANSRLARQVRKMADDAVAKGTGYSETEEELIEESVQPLKQASSRVKSRGIERLASALSGFFDGGRTAGREAAEEGVLASILAEIESDDHDADQNDPKAFYSKSAEETSTCGDVMGLDAQNSDHGLDPKLARIFEAAKEEKEEKEEEAEEAEESEEIEMTEEEEEEKPKASKKASNLRGRQPAVKTLGNISREASSVADDLSKLWESAPDVSKYFGK